ncbi:MAG TPA: glycosyltransferase 87 family protein, partial [Anaerolineaceae bacterium]
MRQSMRASLPLLIFLAALAGMAFAIHTLTRDNTLGTDFYIFYRAGQTAFIDRASPYSDALARQNQLAIFKRPSIAGEDQLGFAYPPYVLLAVWPVLGLGFDWAQAIWAAFLLLSLLTVVTLVYPGAPPWVAITFLCFYPVTFGLILGNFAILIGALVLLIFGLFNGKRPLEPAGQAALGLLLAWLTAKPQFIWLFAAFFLLLALRRRWWPFLAAFGAGLAFFVAISFAILPGWPVLWLESASRYAAYNQSWLILSVLLKDILPLEAVIPVTVVLGAGFLAASAWLFWQWWRGRLDNLLLLAWCGFVVYTFHPRGASYEHVTFLLPMVVWACRQKT